ncbi:MAG: apolipoprotein N-acyltransferase [Rhodospirillaceae bacterium]|nr:apolipoprotein N-acyltransferase [Rhodospirillaceae bacterium]
MAGPGPLGRIAASISVLRGWRRWGFAFALGMFAVAALPPVSAAPVLWLVLPAVVWLIDGTTTKRGAFAVGFWFGFGHFVLGLYWISFAMGVDIARFFYMLPLTIFGLPFLLALFSGFGTLVARLVAWRGIARPLALAVGWTLAEWLRGHALTGFPWNLIGYAWTDWGPVIQLASLIGIYGVSLVTVAVAALPATLAAPLGNGGRGGVAATLAGLAVLAGVAVWGWQRVPDGPVPLHEGITLRLVQPNIAQSDKWDPELFHAHFALQREMSVEPGAAGAPAPTVVIWPETAIPYRADSDPAARQAIAQVAPEGGLVILGAPRRTGEEDARQYWNGLVAVNSAAEVAGTYDKSHLVPFGEYVPFRDLLPFDAVASRVDYSAGPGPRTLDLPGLPPVGPMICYEIIFPGAVTDPQPGAERPQWLLNLTNDAWYGITAGPHQHFAIASVRAVEEGLPLVRVANTGISGIVDPYGRVVAHLPLGSRGVIDGGLPLALDQPPLYARWGDIPVAVLGFVLALAAWLVGGGRRRAG